MSPAPVHAPNPALRHFLVDTDLTPAEQSEVLDLAQEMKADRFLHRPLAGPQTGIVFFDKTSTRTRVSFAAGIADLGGQPLIVNPGESQLGHKEATDTALLERCVRANLPGSPFGEEFFVRKAVGWALRQHARTDPAWVVALVGTLGDRLSGLSRREALKHVGR